MIIFFLGIGLTLAQLTTEPLYCTDDQVHILQTQVVAADNQSFEEGADFTDDEAVRNIKEVYEFEADCTVREGTVL